MDVRRSTAIVCIGTTSLDTGSSTVSVAAAGSVSAIAEQEKKFHQQFEGVARQLNGGRTGLRETWLAVNPAAE